MNLTVPVCWRKLDDYKVSTNPKDPYVDFIKGPASAYSNDIISIGSTATITFSTASNCQFPAVTDFKMHVTPDAALIRVITNDASTVVVEATYKPGVDTQLRMGFTNMLGGPGYNSGKPVIRNEPQHVFPPYQIYAVIILVALAAAAFFLYHRRNRSQWNSD